MISGNVRVEFYIFSHPQGHLQSNVQAKKTNMLIIKLKRLEFIFLHHFSVYHVVQSAFLEDFFHHLCLRNIQSKT